MNLEYKDEGRKARVKVKGNLDLNAVQSIKSRLGSNFHRLEELNICCQKVRDIDEEAAEALQLMKGKLGAKEGNLHLVNVSGWPKTFLKKNGFSNLFQQP